MTSFASVGFSIRSSSMFRFVRRRRRAPRARRTKAHVAHYETHKENARALIHDRLQYWSALYAVAYGRVAIRDQRTRWGSCSTKGNLNFNYRLVFLPIELVDYVVVHELCHLIEFNHSPAFWAHVARAFPDHEARKNILRKLPVHTIGM